MSAKMETTTYEEKMQRCLEIAKELRKQVRPGDTVHSLWDVIFDLEAMWKGRSEEVFFKDKGIDWYVGYGEGFIR